MKVIAAMTAFYMFRLYYGIFWGKENKVEAFHKEVYTYAYSIGGRLAGEHGIGAKKLREMETYTPAGELAIMRTIKAAMDPQLILNPGKIFDL